ncbi:TetR family transcriptional regulator [Amycolatopsis thermophila]|uniref:AcrR family transcriptional regulator n=1 Tax=Amycolatopsis thermophila TaxID=206084 RepID=A0ABU0EMG1_9PSEU|nr:hypothetical protein [Amycolatopsis thermophila]MDQ0376468.1 AcrR family transcriptional regulator [Amycolatopsis thermophila]
MTSNLLGQSRVQKGLSADRIVEAAVELTVNSGGVDRWTVRALAEAIGAYPAVIYHHVGDRAEVVRQVVEAIVDKIPVPAEADSWQDWIRQAAEVLEERLVPIRGVARHLAAQAACGSLPEGIRGPAVRVLDAAGFREPERQACRVVSSLCSLVLVEEAVADVASVEVDGTAQFREGVQLLVDGLEARLAAVKYGVHAAA